MGTAKGGRTGRTADARRLDIQAADIIQTAEHDGRFNGFLIANAMPCEPMSSRPHDLTPLGGWEAHLNPGEIRPAQARISM